MRPLPRSLSTRETCLKSIVCDSCFCDRCVEQKIQGRGDGLRSGRLDIIDELPPFSISALVPLARGWMYHAAEVLWMGIGFDGTGSAWGSLRALRSSWEEEEEGEEKLENGRLSIVRGWVGR